MTKNISLGVQLPPGIGMVINTVDIRDEEIILAMSEQEENLLLTLYIIGPHHVFHMSLTAFGRLHALGFVEMEHRVAFLTEKGSRFAVRNGYQAQKDTWHHKKKLLRKQELQELYSIIGAKPEEENGDSDELPCIRG